MSFFVMFCSSHSAPESRDLSFLPRRAREATGGRPLIPSGGSRIQNDRLHLPQGMRQAGLNAHNRQFTKHAALHPASVLPTSMLLNAVVKREV